MPSLVTKRKTLRRYDIPEAVYFVTASTRRRAPMLRGDAGGAVVSAVQRARAERGLLALAYVVMPNHMHALLKPPPGVSISVVMHFIKRVSRNAIIGHASRGRVWEARFYDRVVRDEREMEQAIAYIHDNPVAAGLCARADDWLWSTASPGSSHDLDTVLKSWNVAE